MKVLTTIVSSIFLSIALQANPIDKIKLMTEEYPPYNMTKNGQLTGLSVEVLELMLQKLDSKQTKKDMEVMPWARAYTLIQKKKDTMLFVMARTKQRENLFKWVGPVGSSVVALVAKKEKNIKINSIEDIKKYKIGTVKDDVAELAVKELGITNFDSISGTNSIATSIKKLQRDRIDLFAYMYQPKSWKVKNFNPDDYENVYTLKKNDFYYALHKDTDTKIVEKLQKTLDGLKEQGIVQKISAKYK